MSIKSFYGPRYFEKRFSKLTIQFLIIFWVLYALLVLVGFKWWSWKVGFLLLSVHQLIGTTTIYREGLYYKPGEKRQARHNKTPAELIKEAKREVAHGKKAT